MSPHRVSPPKIFPDAGHAQKPPSLPPGPADAFRQTKFMLGDETDAVVEGLKLEGNLAEAAAGSKFRNHRVASAMAMWSKSWLNRLQALHALELGNYVAVPTLIRGAADHLAAQRALISVSADEWDEWLAADGIGNAPEQQAQQFRLHPFRSAETLAADQDLGLLYRAAMDLSMPHFGATVLLAAADSDSERVMVTFGDRDYHHGLAELMLGWLIALGVAHLRDLAQEGSPFPNTASAAVAKWSLVAASALSRPDRCTMELKDIDGEQRWLLAQWRRGPSAAPKRVLL